MTLAETEICEFFYLSLSNLVESFSSIQGMLSSQCDLKSLVSLGKKAKQSISSSFILL